MAEFDDIREQLITENPCTVHAVGIFDQAVLKHKALLAQLSDLTEKWKTFQARLDEIRGQRRTLYLALRKIEGLQIVPQVVRDEITALLSGVPEE